MLELLNQTAELEDFLRNTGHQADADKVRAARALLEQVADNDLERKAHMVG